MIILITKYIFIAFLLLIITIFDTYLFMSIDPHDAPLWIGLSMALFGLIAGSLANRSKKNIK